MEPSSTDKQNVVSQVENAFNFIQKLYHESSYLIKEIEGQLAENELNFQFIKASGYGISSRSSTGLDVNAVNYWLLRKFSFAFVAESQTAETKGAQTITDITPELKIIYFRIILNDSKPKEPQLLFGVFYDIKKLKEESYIKKFENLMGHFEYNDTKIFSKFPNIDYEDSYLKLKGKFKAVNLLDLNSSEELVKKVIEPALKLYNNLTL